MLRKSSARDLCNEPRAPALAAEINSGINYILLYKMAQAAAKSRMESYFFALERSGFSFFLVVCVRERTSGRTCFFVQRQLRKRSSFSANWRDINKKWAGMRFWQSAAYC